MIVEGRFQRLSEACPDHPLSYMDYSNCHGVIHKRRAILRNRYSSLPTVKPLYTSCGETFCCDCKRNQSWPWANISRRWRTRRTILQSSKGWLKLNSVPAKPTLPGQAPKRH